MDNFDLKKYLVENKVTRNSRMVNEASTEALEGIADVIANYSTEDPKDAADTVGEMALEFLEGEAVPEGMFNSKMRAGIANILRQHSSRKMSGMEAAKKLAELLKNPANYEEGGAGQKGAKVGSAEGADISVGEESSLQDTQYYIIRVGGKSQTVSVEVAGEPVTLQQVTSETGLTPKKAQIIVNHINSQLGLTEKKVTRNSRMLDENTPAKYTKIKKVTFSKGITGEDGETLTNNPDGSYTFEKGQEDMEGGITTAILKYPNGYGVSGQEYDWNNREYEEEGYTYFYDKKGNQVEDERSLM
jgi:hypothetical protein